MTIRVVKASTADTPACSENELFVEDDRPKTLFSLDERIVNDPLNFFANDTLGQMLFWTILGFIVLFVISHS